MATKKFFLGIIFLAVNAIAEPGGWVSSGGEIFKFAKNPWFVKNTTNVNYCVQFSASEFSISEKDVLPLIQESIAYWKSELDGSRPPGMGSPSGLGSEFFALATQKFVYQTSCGPTVDLEFKFGYKTLDPNEVKELKDPTKFLGVTIRKEYDETNLKGRGVIYISGDTGPFSYQKGSPDIVAEAWKYPKLLKYVITHELGHVFGIPHSGSGLMSEVFLDQLLLKKVAALHVREPFLPFVKSLNSFEICPDPVMPKGSQTFLAEFFGLKNQVDCLRIEQMPNQKNYQVLTKKNQSSEAWKSIGTLYLDMSEITDFSLKPVVMLQLTETQTVFNPSFNQFLLGPVFQTYKMDAHFTFGSSLSPITAQVDLSPESFVVYANHNKKLRQVIAFGNPLTFQLVRPF